jgi:RHS repeat-associated protein
LAGQSDNGSRLVRVWRNGYSGYTAYGYSARDWISSVHNRATGGSVYYDANYYYNDGAVWDHTGNPMKRVENFGGSDYTTTLRYDSVYRQTEETKRDNGNNVEYTLGYEYDEVGNRIGMTRDGSELTFTYDDNNKLTYVEATSPTASATMGYDNAGNMTGVSGALYGSKTLTYDDESRLASVAYGGVTDTYTYNWEGLRTRARLNGTYHRYLYNGERVLQDLGDDGDVLTCYTLEDGSYSGSLLIINFPATNIPRFPLYDEIGSVRGLVNTSGTVTDSYDLDTFGTQLGSTGSTPNPYRYGGAWGYITDPSGLLQLGARFYWPEVGRFVSQDPARDGIDWYAYVDNQSTTEIDPRGLFGAKDCVRKCVGTFGTHQVVSYLVFWVSHGLEAKTAAYVCARRGVTCTIITRGPQGVMVAIKVVKLVSAALAAYNSGVYVGCMASCHAPGWIGRFYRDFWKDFY